MKIEGNGFEVKTFQQPQQNRTDSVTASVEAAPVVNQRAHQVEVIKAATIEVAEISQAENEHEVIKAIERANKHIRSFDRKLEFSIHDTTKQIMVKVIDTENDTVIREIPSEKILDMVAHLWEVAGILVDEKR
ncbi:MAG: flagellar biosynthesis protein FlaG [Firmicutes bacterium HGW-Firmicutes-1]|nr:MAG: flagellar biosynthesis protein FlaG [Firmicutes bacterium HGW-Firmicutes-1]